WARTGKRAPSSGSPYAPPRRSSTFASTALSSPKASAGSWTSRRASTRAGPLVNSSTRRLHATRRSSSVTPLPSLRASRGRYSSRCISRCSASCARGPPRLQRTGQVEPASALGIGLGGHDVEALDEHLGRVGARLDERVDRIVASFADLGR